MKTIEERAKEYSPDPWDENYILPAREGHIVNRQRQAYIAGAKDQQYIDKLLIKSLINKAWSLAYSMYQVGKDHLIPMTKDEFIKAMQEQYEDVYRKR